LQIIRNNFWDNSGEFSQVNETYYQIAARQQFLELAAHDALLQPRTLDGKQGERPYCLCGALNWWAQHLIFDKKAGADSDETRS
jgi:hypothetical protein